MASWHSQISRIEALVLREAERIGDPRRVVLGGMSQAVPIWYGFYGFTARNP